MTGERTRRFPLGLADLVREPRRRDGQDSRGGEARAPLGGAGKAGTAVAKPAAKPVAKPAVPHVSGGVGTSKPGQAPGAGLKRPVSSKPAALARPSDVRGSDAAPRAVPTRSNAVQRTHGTHGAPGTPATPASGAPGVPLNGAVALTSERVRERMVERLRANGIVDARVLQALAGVPRHMFVDPGLATQAYEDAALPIGHQQTISKPSVVARMLELAGAGRALDRVLEIGTGCGYQAAVLSCIARDVYSIERIKPLYERAKTNLRPLRIPNIRLHYGDGRLGMPSAAPFDAIVIAAAGFEVPQALLEQLAIGGRLVAPVASPAGAGGEATQVLTLVERTGPAQWRESRLDRVFFVPLKSGVI
ncbi:protein-L-isoaspartate(D-aspartate) O-methyltransferase [Paraburkholderia sp.]|uniref:protein-L-isoaspartate(D-aspartate) O-methyltransferase n=1 Tax=Paraburkholderia sp. TaxID=1926495 RepID=UPI0025D4403A|nr:protein-L-isoaspartate(D-aspartate) O-methyltransferase [Paraburkholderia sp.]